MVVIVFLLFCYYLPLEKRRILHLNKLESPSPKYILRLILWDKKCSEEFIRTFSSGKQKRIDTRIPQVLVIRDSWDHCDSTTNFSKMWNGKQNWKWTEGYAIRYALLQPSNTDNIDVLKGGSKVGTPSPPRFTLYHSMWVEGHQNNSPVPKNSIAPPVMKFLNPPLILYFHHINQV